MKTCGSVVREGKYGPTISVSSVVSFTLQPLYPVGKTTQCTISGPQRRSGQHGEGKFLALQGLEL
jgi:hypothetical protein